MKMRRVPPSRCQSACCRVAAERMSLFCATAEAFVAKRTELLLRHMLLMVNADNRTCS
jgi:hypothetical protein